MVWFTNALMCYLAWCITCVFSKWQRKRLRKWYWRQRTEFIFGGISEWTPWLFNGEFILHLAMFICHFFTNIPQTHLRMVTHFMSQWCKSPLVHLMARRLFGAEKWPEAIFSIGRNETNYSEFRINMIPFHYWNFFQLLPAKCEHFVQSWTKRSPNCSGHFKMHCLKANDCMLVRYHWSVYRQFE